MEMSTVTRHDSEETNKSLDGAASFADLMFGFLERNNENLTDFVDRDENGDGDEDHSHEVKVVKNKVFWETQEQLLLTTLYGTTSSETRIRLATKEALSELHLIGVQCSCRRSFAVGCRNCLQRELSICLQNMGFNCYVCKSKWKTTLKIPAGEHTYLEVLERSNADQKGDKRIVIELNFRTEFEMGKATESYNRLFGRLPELFIGKPQRLKALINVLCFAWKKCMKEKKMHLAPWRKQNYMQAKWLGTYEITTPVPLPMGVSDRPQKPKASMLTFDLRENLPGLHCAAVEVVY